MKKVLLLFSFIWLLYYPSFSQDLPNPTFEKTCGQNEGYLEQLRINQPEIYASFLEEQSRLSAERPRTESTVAYKIPVVFYLFDNGDPLGAQTGSYMGDITDEVIYEVLEYLNESFLADAQHTLHNPLIQFCLATKVDGQDLSPANSVLPIGTTVHYNNGTQSVVVGQVDQAPDDPGRGIENPGIFRIELSSSFNVSGTGGGAYSSTSPWIAMTDMMLLGEHQFLRVAVGSRGWSSATFPFGAFNWAGTGTQGVYVRGDHFGTPSQCSHCTPGILGKILPHEVGHYLGLYHANNQGVCAGNHPPGPGPLSCTTTGDFVCDTEPRPSVGYIPPYPCTYDDICNLGPDIVYDNIMDDVAEVCQMEFTPGQVDRMEATLITYYPDYYADCSLKKAGAPCMDRLQIGPYCAGFDVQLPSVTGSATFVDVGGSTVMNDNGFIPGHHATSGHYFVEIIECGFTESYEYDIVDCSVSVDFTAVTGNCHNACMTDITSYPTGAHSFTYTWTFPGPPMVKTNTPSICYYECEQVDDDTEICNIDDCRQVCLDVSFWVHGSHITGNSICKTVCSPCDAHARQVPTISRKDIQKITVSPNPNHGSFTLTGFVEKEEFELSITDLKGSILRTEKILPSTVEIEVNAGELPAGTYLINVVQGGVVHSTKVVIQ